MSCDMLIACHHIQAGIHVQMLDIKEYHGIVTGLPTKLHSTKDTKTNCLGTQWRNLIVSWVWQNAAAL